MKIDIIGSVASGKTTLAKRISKQYNIPYYEKDKFETKDNEIKLTVPVENDTVWLTQAQMTELFQVDRTVITRHVNNVFKEKELVRESNVQKMHIANSDRPVQFYSLEVIISVGFE